MLLHGDKHTTNVVTSRKNLIMKNSSKSQLTLEHRLTTSARISLVVGACLAFSACGAIAEKVTEEGAERILESESGGNVDLDFNNGDGSFSVKTEDGGFSFDEDGNFVVTDQDGSVFTGSASEDQIVVTDQNGDPVLDVTGDGDNGELSIQGDDGEAVYRVVTEIPSEWPSNIPRPEGLAIEGGTYISADGESMISIIGTPSGSAVDYTDKYLVAVAAAGWTETGRYDQSADGSVTAQRTYERDGWALNINGYDDGDTAMVNISLLSTDG